MEVNDARRLRNLAEDNPKLKQFIAEMELESAP
jgi:hypothetical protein